LENQPRKDIFIKYWDSISLFTILLIIALLRFSFLEVPLERDEGAYAYIAQLLLDGIAPYTQAYSLYFPGIFIIYALTFLVFGQTIFAIHFCLLIANLVTIVFIYLIGKRLFDSLTGIISGATFGLLGLNPHAQGLFSHGEPFTMLFICTGVYILLLGINSNKKFLFIWS
jgi:4-amino-4-deoxy-L-arabinose transferase-like glycosyltransferase